MCNVQKEALVLYRSLNRTLVSTSELLGIFNVCGFVKGLVYTSKRKS